MEYKVYPLKQRFDIEVDSEVDYLDAMRQGAQTLLEHLNMKEITMTAENGTNILISDVQSVKFIDFVMDRESITFRVEVTAIAVVM